MTSIQIVSDLHIEFLENKSKYNLFNPSADILALLGDICCCGTNEEFNQFKNFILEVLPNYQLILFVAGNHEYYCTEKRPPKLENTMRGINNKIEKFFSETSPKLKFLNNSMTSIKIKKTCYTFIGTTLWTYIPEDKAKMIESNMNDYNNIYTTVNKKITAEYVTDMHLNARSYLRNAITRLSKLNRKIIVLTHHKPYLSDIKDRTEISVGYESDLTQLMNKNVILWGYGHTHIADRSKIKNTLLYSNPKGYPRQKTKFNTDAIIDL